MKDFYYMPSEKLGLGFGYIVKRGRDIHLRILPNRDESTRATHPCEIMTATAREDNARASISYDLAISCKAAVSALESLRVNDTWVLKYDALGRPYIVFFICNIDRVEELDPLVEAYFKEFDALLNKVDHDQGSGNDLIEIYHCLAVDDGEPVYLSDGVWLNSDGSLS